MTTYKDIVAGVRDSRQNTATETVALFGRSYCYVTCPFCSTEVKAYIWSLCGGGKRCPGCGAMHDGYGVTHKKTV